LLSISTCAATAGVWEARAQYHREDLDGNVRAEEDVQRDAMRNYGRWEVASGRILLAASSTTVYAIVYRFG